MPVQKQTNTTNTSKWFHNEKPVTSSNKATAYLDGEEYMAEVYKLIKTTKAGDFIYLTGWLFSIDQCLLGQKKKASNLMKVLMAKAEKGVEVKILPWHPSFEAEAVLHNALCHSYLYFKSWELNNPNFKVSLSQTGIHGSHHQKSIMIKSKGSVYALLGGIDIAKDR